MPWIQCPAPMLQQSPSPVLTNTWRSGRGILMPSEAREAGARPRGTADAGDEHGLFRTQVVVTAKPLHRRQDGIVAAAGAPARNAALIILQVMTLLVHPEQAIGNLQCHDRRLTLAISRAAPRQLCRA